MSMVGDFSKMLEAAPCKEKRRAIYEGMKDCLPRLIQTAKDYKRVLSDMPSAFKETEMNMIERLPKLIKTQEDLCQALLYGDPKAVCKKMNQHYKDDNPGKLLTFVDVVFENRHLDGSLVGTLLEDCFFIKDSDLDKEISAKVAQKKPSLLEEIYRRVKQPEKTTSFPLSQEQKGIFEQWLKALQLEYGYRADSVSSKKTTGLRFFLGFSAAQKLEAVKAVKAVLVGDDQLVVGKTKLPKAALQGRLGMCAHTLICDMEHKYPKSGHVTTL